MARMSKWAVLTGIASVAIPAVAIEVRHAEGIEIISGRPAKAASATSSGTVSRTSGSVSARFGSPSAGLETTGRNDTFDDTSDSAGSASDSVTQERLRAAEAALHDQIDAYNQALIEGAPREVLEPHEAAIRRTLEHIEMLLRPARQHES